jgi:hypothetical protein
LRRSCGTLKTELRRKNYGLNTVQGLDCKKTWLSGAYLQETRDLDIIMHKNRRFNIKGGLLNRKTKEFRVLNIKARTYLKGFL